MNRGTWQAPWGHKELDTTERLTFFSTLLQAMDCGIKYVCSYGAELELKLIVKGNE